MIITLSTGTHYNLHIADDRRRLKKYIPTLRRRKAAELDLIAQSIEKEAMLCFYDVDMYFAVKKVRSIIAEFSTRYYQADDIEKQYDQNRYSFINGRFYRLPKTENSDAVVYALIDKYVYERKRNDRDSEVCLNLRQVIHKFIPGAMHKSDRALQEILTVEETRSRTYYGDCLSDDSDSDAEAEFNAFSPDKKTRKLRKSAIYRDRAEIGKYQKAMDGRCDPPAIDFKVRPVIQRNDVFDRRKINEDLSRVNEKLKYVGVLSAEFLETIDTKFVVAQYRGVHYVTSQWDMTARREHRVIDERRQPQYSSAVFKCCDVTSYHQYLDRLRLEAGFREKLEVAAKKISSLLLLMQHSDPVSWDGFTYVSIFHLIQYWYSSNYDGLPKKLSDEFKKHDSVVKPFLLNAERPLLSTADIPYHALKYAYGLKLYQGYEDQRLRPRWRVNGRAERPYSGKVYVSLHPLNDYTDRNPSHVTSMFKKGLLPLTNIISPERETSFLGFLPEDRVVLQHSAKYPSFKAAYKNVYEYKYGITKSMYEKVQRGFREFPPHSTERKKLIRVLGEYLCAYQEVRLIQKAARIADKCGSVLIYRNEDGGFSLYHPRTPQATGALLPLVNAKRAIYRMLAPNKLARITLLTRGQVKTGLDRASLEKGSSERRMECMRFFSSKRKFEKDDVVVPVRAFVL